MKEEDRNVVPLTEEDAAFLNVHFDTTGAKICRFEVYMAIDPKTDPTPLGTHFGTFTAERYPWTTWDAEEGDPIALSDGTVVVHFTVSTVLGERTRKDLLKDTRILAWTEVDYDAVPGKLTYPVVWTKAGDA